MATGELHRGTNRLRDLAQNASSRREKPGLEVLFQTPVPPFHVVYPAPQNFDKDHPIFRMHRAANRVYHGRLKTYTRQSKTLTAPALMDFIRADVLAQLLVTDRRGFGPIGFDHYVYLHGFGLHAWLPAHRERAQEMLLDFQRHYRKKKERVSVLANNAAWPGQG